jgi:hypothetical protein
MTYHSGRWASILGDRLRRKAGWLEDVSDALKELGGEAHLSAIYEKVLAYRRTEGEPIGEYKAWVRYYLQQNSRGRGYDIFSHVGPSRSGRWRRK